MIAKNRGCGRGKGNPPLPNVGRKLKSAANGEFCGDRRSNGVNWGKKVTRRRQDTGRGEKGDKRQRKLALTFTVSARRAGVRPERNQIHGRC